MNKTFTLKSFLVVVLALTGLSVTAQTTIQVGAASTYSTIQSAYNTGIPADISSSGAYIIELQSDYNPTTETYPITLGAKTGASASNSITIKPAAGVTKTLSATNKTVSLSGCIINSATSITVPDATGLSVGMYISNTKYTTPITAINGTTLTVGTQGTTTGTYAMVAGPATGTTTLYLNGAQYVTIDGVGRTGDTQLIIDNPNRIASQSILLKNDASHNTIKNCTVKGASQISIAAVTGTIADNGTIFIYNTTSTTADKGNDYNTIDNCDIVDGSSIPITHVCISGSATATNDNNKITNCNLDNAYLTVNTTGLTPGYVVVSSNTTNTEISNNRLYATKTIVPAGIYAYGIITTSGTNTTISSNAVGYGAKDGSGTFTIPSSATAATTAGIYIKGGSATVSNNTVAGFNVFCMSFSGIWFAGSSTGSASANTINNIKSSTTFTTIALAGIYSQTSGTVSYSNNTISNLSNVNTLNTALAMTKGLYVSAASSSTFSGNTIFNLTAGDPAASSLSSAPNLAIGIDATKNITTIEKNLVYNINAFSTANTAVVNGIKLNAGIDAGFTIKNNLVRLGTDVTTNANIYGIYQIAATAATNKFNIYNNSVYIGGVAPSSAPVSTYAYNRTATGIVGVIDLRDNILSNQRVQGATENHYAVGLLAATDLGTSDYNIYQYNGKFGVIGTTSKADLTAWQGTLYTSPANNDANSYSSNPQFIAPAATIPDLRIIPDVYSNVDAKGIDVSVADDYFGSIRSGLSPTDIGAYAYISSYVLPTVTISSGTSSTTNANPIPVTITFNKAITGFTLSDLTVTNGSAGNFVAVSASIYTADIIPTASGLVTVDIAAGAASDAATNGNVAATQFTRTYLVPPTVTISSATSSVTKVNPIPVTITFNEDVTGFTLSDLTVTNGSAGNFVAVSASIYTADIIPTASGLVTVDIAAGAASDAATNGNVAATQFTRTYLVPPTVTISSATPSVTKVNPIPVTITFNEDVTGFTLSDLTVTNGSAGNFVAVSASTYTADIIPTALGLVTVDIAAGAASDAATNGNIAAAQFARTYDIGSGVENVKDQVFAYSSDNGIVIVAAGGQDATIYSVIGQLVKKTTLSSDKTFVALSPGFYAVFVKGQNIKVLVK